MDDNNLVHIDNDDNVGGLNGNRQTFTSRADWPTWEASRLGRKTSDIVRFKSHRRSESDESILSDHDNDNNHNNNHDHDHDIMRACDGLSVCRKAIG